MWQASEAAAKSIYEAGGLVPLFLLAMGEENSEGKSKLSYEKVGHDRGGGCT